MHLARQPALLLGLLLARDGDLVSRQEISEELWPDGHHVVADLGINNTVRRLRRALGDSHEDPEYVETLPGLGYRLCCPLEQVPPVASTSPALGFDVDRGGWHWIAIAGLGLAAAAWTLGRVMPVGRPEVERLQGAGE